MGWFVVVLYTRTIVVVLVVDSGMIHMIVARMVLIVGDIVVVFRMVVARTVVA